MIDKHAYKALALSFPETVEGSHFEAMDFRVAGKIFATWRDDRQQAVVKLTPDDQRLMVETMPDMLSAIPGAWGLKGWTRLDLAVASEDEARHILGVAWKTVAPKTVQKRHAL